MKINVKVTPNAKKNGVIEEGGALKVRLNAPAAGGKANSALIEALAGYFNVRKSSIRIVSGVKSRDKTVEIG